MGDLCAGGRSIDAAAVLWQWRAAALALIAIASVVFALDTDEPWWGSLQETVELVGFVVVLGGPVIAVSSLVSGLVPTRTIVRVVLDLVAAAWAAWMAAILVSYSYIRPEGALPRSAWLVAAGSVVLMLLGGWRLEDVVARRRLARRRDRSIPTAA